MLTLAILGILGVAVAFRWLAVRRRAVSAAERRMGIPLIALPADEELAALPRPIVRQRRAPSGYHDLDAELPPLVETDVPRAATPADRAPGPRPERTERPDERVTADSMRFAPPPGRRTRQPADLAPVDGNGNGNGNGLGGRTDGRSLQAGSTPRPPDGTLQFLPGRLEVVHGRDEEEIRFVRPADADHTEITFGRADGEPYRHVQLNQATVSRNHARMTLDGSTWLLTNLSATNPVVVNGRELGGVDSTVVLRDGDQIEMGEVAFRFHDR